MCPLRNLKPFHSIQTRNISKPLESTEGINDYTQLIEVNRIANFAHILPSLSETFHDKNCDSNQYAALKQQCSNASERISFARCPFFIDHCSQLSASLSGGCMVLRHSP